MKIDLLILVAKIEIAECLIIGFCSNSRIIGVVE